MGTGVKVCEGGVSGKDQKRRRCEWKGPEAEELQVEGEGECRVRVSIYVRVADGSLFSCSFICGGANTPYCVWVGIGVNSSG